jgi:hypothetical protein
MGRLAGWIGERQRDHAMDRGRRQGRRVLSRTKPATASRMNRSSQRQTLGFDTSARRTDCDRGARARH